MSGSLGVHYTSSLHCGKVPNRNSGGFRSVSDLHLPCRADTGSRPMRQIHKSSEAALANIEAPLRKRKKEGLNDMLEWARKAVSTRGWPGRIDFV